MRVLGDYQSDGYAHVERLIPPEIAKAFLQGMKKDLGSPPVIALSHIENYPNLLTRPAFEVYGHHYKPMLHFLWGLTPLVSQLVGRDLLPTYDYFRIYREGDTCRVHSDRLSCEHSLSLTLDYSDGVPWNLEVERQPSSPSAEVADDFGSVQYASIAMNIGDAVLYSGVSHRHGRVSPNPNEWSAHLFLHWVDREGPYSDKAFDGQLRPANVNFSFA